MKADVERASLALIRDATSLHFHSLRFSPDPQDAVAALNATPATKF